MTKHSTKQLLNLTAITALTATAGLAVANENVHADVKPTDDQSVQAQKQVSAQDQYNQAQNNANQQINQQSQANADQEKAMQQQNEAANQADAKSTNDAVAKLQDQINQEAGAAKSQADASYAAKSQAVASQASQATSQENASYAKTVSDQTAANQASETKLASDNAKALSDAAKNTYTPAQKQALKDSAATTKNNALASAQNVKSDAEKAAQDELNKAQTNAQVAHDQAVETQKKTNAQRLADAQKAYNEAVANAPKTGVVNVAIPNTKYNPDSSDINEDLVYPNIVDSFSNVSGKLEWFDITDENKSSIAKAAVHNIDEIPMDGKPGIIYYANADGVDTSERINGWDSLTDEQYAFLNEYLADEMTGIRNYVQNNITKNKRFSVDGQWSYIFASGPTITTKEMMDNEKQIISFRNQHNIGGDGTLVHTADWADNHHIEMPVGYGYGEDLNGIAGNKPKTMLQALCIIHNELQVLAYGELYTKNFTSDGWQFSFDGNATLPLSGHLLNILESSVVAFGVDKNNEFVINFAFSSPDDVPVHTPEISQILAAQSGQGTPDLNDPSVVKAAQHVKDVQIQNSKDLTKVENESLTDAGKTAYQVAMQKATDDYASAVNKINQDYDAEIKRVNALPESNDQLKASLDQKLTDLKKADAQKLADLKKAHEAKLAKIKADADKELADYKQQLQDQLNSVDPQKTQQIKDLKAKHEAFVKANDQKLSDLKAANAASLAALKAKLNANLADLHAHLFPQDVAHADVHEGNKNVVAGHSNTMRFANSGAVVLLSGNSSVATGNKGNAKSKASLPQTGNHEAVAATLLGAMMTMLGLGLGHKKREF